jgi:hypothetical protein
MHFQARPRVTALRSGPGRQGHLAGGHVTPSRACRPTRTVTTPCPKARTPSPSGGHVPGACTEPLQQPHSQAPAMPVPHHATLSSRRRQGRPLPLPWAIKGRHSFLTAGARQFRHPPWPPWQPPPTNSLSRSRPVPTKPPLPLTPSADQTP